MRHSIGIVRQVDQLGRIIIPKETRDLLGIEPGDALEIYVDSEGKFLPNYSVFKEVHTNQGINNSGRCKVVASWYSKMLQKMMCNL